MSTNLNWNFSVSRKENAEEEETIYNDGIGVSSGGSGCDGGCDGDTDTILRGPLCGFER